ncbi:MAG: ArsR family transcriptional regulator [Nitrososphaerota archaeon]
MPKNKKEIIEVLEEISSKLSDIISLLRLGQKSMIEMSKSRLLASDLRAKVYDLCDGKHTVLEISKELAKPQPLISRYLKELENGGLIKSERKGNKIFYVKVV